MSFLSSGAQLLWILRVTLEVALILVPQYAYSITVKGEVWICRRLDVNYEVIEFGWLEGHMDKEVKFIE